MSKSGTKSMRFGTLLEQLQKLCLASSEGKNELDVEQLRYTTNKIQQLLSSQEKCRKDLMTKLSDGISTLLVALEITADTQVVLNILGCLCELLTTGKRASVLAAKGTVDILLRGLVSGSKEGASCEEVLLLSHVILTKVGPKDRKLCVKARLMGALQITLNMIKNNTTNFKILQPTLQMLKLYCANSVNCGLLGKAGAVGVLLKITSSCGHKRVICLKLILDIIAALVKSKSGAAKAVNHSALPLLLQMACDWQRTDHHNRQTPVRKSILTVLKNITMTKTGKKAFIQAEGIKVLYSLSLESLDCRELDGVNNLSSQILRRCFPTNRLPVPSLSSPVVFPLLDLNSAPGSHADYYLDGSGEEDESSDVESEEEDEDSDSECLEDKDQEAKAANKEQEPENGEGAARAKVRDDLNMYDKFFPELFEFQDLESNKSAEEDDVGPDTIVIPTAGVDPHGSPVSSAVHSPQPDGTGAARAPDREATESLSPAMKFSHTSLNSVASDDSGVSPPWPADSTNRTCASMTCEQLTAQEGRRELHTPSPEAARSSVLPIVKKTAPDLYGHFPPLEPEPLGQKRTGMQRTMIFRDIERLIHPQRVVNRIVYDLDALLKETSGESDAKQRTSSKEHLKPAQARKASNCSISDGDRSPVEDMAKPLKFESRFESGNLRKAVQVRDHEYDLILNPDVNCKHHHQWFYFEVRNMEADVPYRFNIVNCEKLNSQFNFGMQPVFYSTQEALDGRPGWVRAGTGVCYYRNYFARFQEANAVNPRGKTYYTTTFTVTFPHADDVCYFAYHFPYTYSLLQTHLQQLEASLDPLDVFYRRSTLCHTLSGVPCDVITITACPTGRSERAVNALRNRPYIFLSGRIHPGESNSSWVMKGIIDFLLSNSYTARQLREMCIFKIVPMLNPDGVINGCHRCSLSGDDLNRRWLDPSMLLHPTIYHTKGLLLYLQALAKAPLVYCDLHGHSRKKNVFMYGCSTAATVAASSSSSGELDSDVVEAIREKVAELSGSDSTSSMEPNDIVEDPGYRTLPRILHNIAPAFSLGSCSFIVEPAKESTARVVVWREIGVTRSYTMESTYSGCDQGPYKGYHVGTRELEEMGRFFCAGLLRVSRSYLRREGLRQIFDSASGPDLSAGDSWIRTSELFMPATPYTHENTEHPGMPAGAAGF